MSNSFISKDKESEEESIYSEDSDTDVVIANKKTYQEYRNTFYVPDPKCTAVTNAGIANILLNPDKYYLPSVELITKHPKKLPSPYWLDEIHSITQLVIFKHYGKVLPFENKVYMRYYQTVLSNVSKKTFEKVFDQKSKKNEYFLSKPIKYTMSKFKRKKGHGYLGISGKEQSDNFGNLLKLKKKELTNLIGNKFVKTQVRSALATQKAATNVSIGWKARNALKGMLTSERTMKQICSKYRKLFQEKEVELELKALKFEPRTYNKLLSDDHQVFLKKRDFQVFNTSFALVSGLENLTTEHAKRVGIQMIVDTEEIFLKVERRKLVEQLKKKVTGLYREQAAEADNVDKSIKLYLFKTQQEPDAMTRRYMIASLLLMTSSGIRDAAAYQELIDAGSKVAGMCYRDFFGTIRRYYYTQDDAVISIWGIIEQYVISGITPLKFGVLDVILDACILQQVGTLQEINVVKLFLNNFGVSVVEVLSQYTIQMVLSSVVQTDTGECNEKQLYNSFTAVTLMQVFRRVFENATTEQRKELLLCFDFSLSPCFKFKSFGTAILNMAVTGLKGASSVFSETLKANVNPEHGVFLEMLCDIFEEPEEYNNQIKIDQIINKCKVYTQDAKVWFDFLNSKSRFVLLPANTFYYPSASTIELFKNDPALSNEYRRYLITNVTINNLKMVNSIDADSIKFTTLWHMLHELSYYENPVKTLKDIQNCVNVFLTGNYIDYSAFYQLVQKFALSGVRKSANPETLNQLFNKKDYMRFIAFFNRKDFIIPATGIEKFLETFGNMLVISNGARVNLSTLFSTN